MPRQTPRADGETNGHGCGHNHLGAGCTGAGLALKAMMEATGTPGTIRVYGCAMEETQAGKAYFARDGRFDDLDAAIAFHPGPVAAAGMLYCNAIRNMKREFIGQTAHAGVEPWAGRSALDAAEIAAHSINMMREHVKPTARIHYIFEDAGVAPNVVPDFARIWITLREIDAASVDALAEWCTDIAHGAALATQTEANPFVYSGMAEIIPNRPLAERFVQYMNEVGLSWTEAEQDFARLCQRNAGIEESGLATEVLPFIEEARSGGSSDVGDVSWNAPTAIFIWPGFAQGIAFHTWAVTAAGGMSIGDKSALSSATIMAATGFEVMTDAQFRAAIRTDFDARIDGRAYVSGIPAEQKEPIDIPDYLHKAGNDEIDATL